MRMRTLAIIALVCVCAPTVWGQAITGFSGGSEYDSYYGSLAGDVVGWRFSVTEPLTINSLGIWNGDQTGGLESAHMCGVWDGSQTLLGSVSVDNTGTVVGAWTYAAVTPFGVNAGETYTAGCLYVSGDDDWYISSASSMTTAAEINFLGAVYPLEGELGFVYPVNDSGSTSFGRFGPNFLFDSGIPVELMTFSAE